MNNIPKDKIIKVIEIFFPDAKIYLFGSRARNTHTERSNINIAIDAERNLTLTEIGQINSMIDALNMAQHTIVVDFNRVKPEIKDNILKDNILWKNSSF